MGGKALANIRETVASAELAWLHVWTPSQQRHGFAGVITTGPGGITAVIGAEDDQITRLQGGPELR